MRMPGFASGSYVSQSAVMAGERCINMLPEQVPQGGKTRSALVPVPGLVTFATMTQQGGRGIFETNGRCFTVFGPLLDELNEDGTRTNRGTVVVDANPVTFDTNGDAGNELMITSGGRGYILDLGTNVLTTPLASGSNQCGHVDGFLISLNSTTSVFRISDSLDGQTWSGVQVAQRTSAPDRWVSMMIANSEIVLWGNKTGETWYNAGLPTFPFARRPEGVFDVGIAANFSAARFNGSVAWLGRTERGSLGVYFLDGYNPVRISRPGLDWLLQEYQDDDQISSAIGWAYDREGHNCYVLTFPLAQRTHVYDAITDQWHERGFWDQDIADFTAYRPIYHANCFGKHLVCDADSNLVYEFSSTTYTDAAGQELRRVRRTPHLNDEHKKLYFPLVELECDRGVGNTVAPGDDPLVALRYSNDGGNTWGASRTRPIGQRGEYDQRARWEMCGSGRDRVWELWQTDPVAARWYDLFVDVQPGVH